MEYPRNLEMLAQQRYIGKYLESGSKEILIERAKSLEGYILKKRRNRPLEWRFLISQERPLTFIRNDVDGYKLQVDISCEIEGKNDEIEKQNISLRIWSWDEKISYRENLDNAKLKNELESLGWKRTILRFHFDLRGQDVIKPEPIYHFHVGGIPQGDENCWFPKQIKVPRFAYTPMDFILLCEFVLVNFFSRESEQLRKKPEWKSLVKKSQELFQRPYLIMCERYLNSDTDTLLGNLVTIHEEA